MEVDDPLRNRQTKARAAAGPRHIGPEKPLEHSRQIVRFYPDPGVTHRYASIALDRVPRSP